jgi:hypothetical protein
MAQFNLQKSWAKTNEYGGRAELNRYSPKLLVSHAIKALKTKLNAVIFKEWVNTKQQRTNWQTESQTKIFNYLIVGLKAASVSRFPGFNDLYWKPGGNPDLKSEQTKEFESNISSTVKLNKLEFSGKISAYKRWIQNHPNNIISKPKSYVTREVFTTTIIEMLNYTFPDSKISKLHKYCCDYYQIEW